MGNASPQPASVEQVSTTDNDLIKILIVDDDKTNRLILQAMLAKLGYEVVVANDGQHAIEIFIEESPHLILMDVMMPVLNGYEATAEIRKLCNDRFVPIIFLTAVTNDKDLAKCIESGGDDFLVKPYNYTILKSKIDALLRLRSLYYEINEQKNELQLHHARLQQEHKIVSKIFSRVTNSGCLDAECIKYILKPQSVTNGDVLLATKTPSGNVQIFIGDFTGHGLSAAIGILPVSNVFYSMSAKGFAITHIVSELNTRLHEILPTGIFCSACFIEIDIENNSMIVWNGGIPDAFVIDQDNSIKTKLTSKHLPLGVLDKNRFENAVEIVEVDQNDRIYMYSDGFIEARNVEGELFGEDSLEQILTNDLNNGNHFESACNILDKFCENAEQSDDITLIEVSCDKLYSIQKRDISKPWQHKEPSEWNVSYELTGKTIKNTDPVPFIIQEIIELQGLYHHREHLFMILSELYINAVDHGLLELESDLKNTPDGFTEYYKKREMKLSELDNASITIGISHCPRIEGGQLTISIRDTGTGFDRDKTSKDLESNNLPQGRGVALIDSLCEELRYEGNGNHAIAIYQWES
ncbi:MAG: SpoIIE family protein phosphatase [Gammaproteobacteria bacterium]